MYSFEGKKVLIADGSGTERDIIKTQLTKAGAEVVCAFNGIEAVSLAKNGGFDFAVMDVMLPAMDGFDTANELRANGFDKPIIGMSEYDQEYMLIGAQKNGMNGFLEKPLELERLRKLLDGNDEVKCVRKCNGRSLLILCAGQFGEITKEIAEALGYEKIDFLDDYVPGTLGKLTDYRKFVSDHSDAVVAADSITLRMDYIEKLRIVGYNVPVLVHPEAYVAPSVTVGEGTIIQARAAISTGCTVGKGCIISMSANINHHSQIGDYCHIACNSTVMQNTKVKPCTTTSIGQLYFIEPSIKRHN